MQQTQEIRFELKQYMDAQKSVMQFLDQFFNYDFSQQDKELTTADIQKWMQMEERIETLRHKYLSELKRLK